eukprot:COSAG03_NODE_13411_length_504_cov_0.844444_1_plen_33_part_10
MVRECSKGEGCEKLEEPGGRATGLRKGYAETGH